MFSDKLIRYSLLFSGIAFILALCIVVLFFPRLPPYIPFFNSMPWGEARLAPTRMIFGLFILFFIVLVVNNVMSILFYEREPLLARMLSVGSFLVVLLGCIASLQIIILVV